MHNDSIFVVIHLQLRFDLIMTARPHFYYSIRHCCITRMFEKKSFRYFLFNRRSFSDVRR